ncbi:hypothetical protein AFLA_011086 [Aspergillus flavus NRRL3357]|nr:hypothetical protein AFLA_011086 [Aspergillus flavus NRRL3357]
MTPTQFSIFPVNMNLPQPLYSTPTDALYLRCINCLFVTHPLTPSVTRNSVRPVLPLHSTCRWYELIPSAGLIHPLGIGAVDLVTCRYALPCPREIKENRLQGGH